MSDDLVKRLRDYAENGCRSWQGISAVFTEAADEITRLRSLGGDGGEAWPGRNADLQRRRVVTLAQLGLFLSLPAMKRRLTADQAEIASELYAEVVMALAIEDAEDTDIALEIARDHPEGDTLVALSSKQVMDRESVERVIAEYQIGMGLSEENAWSDAHGIGAAILSLASPAVEDGWLPIETAPKDGSKIALLDNNVETAAIGEWMVDIEWRNAGKRPGESLAVPSWFPIANPTHWCPLPAPPAKGVGE